MRTIVLTLCLLVATTISAQEIHWMSFEDAVAMTKNEGNTKKVFIDVYTDWCGWCKKMDKDTFQNPEVAAYMQENFYMVKFNAEGKEPIEFDGRTFNYVPSGRRGYHELAAALLQNRLSYPTVVFLDENMKMLSPVPGYQKVDPFLQIARYFGEDIYKEQDWKSYAGVGK
ncbi:thioredoxin family protein [Muricauda sp. SCSIO 64092]|uniref:thioredoxin family protein n=1 Tax=Allomuricauda sp. SCSIO 64092 TaxID=2908842 RepID=UPI001FF3AE5B|nr:thioredoxin fold domain-containing protein [Muricauda sp. SCSIO 64092]UOY05601.1 thioredoxin family protein [Muricauda sp. SCSIO 64092]